jgi:hypothetical protein
MEVEETVRQNFPESPVVWVATDACLSVCATLLLRDISHPVGLNLQDVPSSWKTTVLDFFDVPDVTYRSDHFTPKSFVTHAANVKRQELQEIDLLPRIQNRVMVVPELAPLFGVRKEDLLDNIAILTRVFDGKGLITDSGVRGRRGYQGDYIFAWLGATTPLPDAVWYMLGKLGSRWLFLSMDSEEMGETELTEMLMDTHTYEQKVRECQFFVSSYLAGLFTKFGIKGATWERDQDDPELVKVIARLAQIVRRLRGVIAVWSEGEEYTLPIVEYPPRLASLLYDVARGHALVHGRNALTEEDVKLVATIAFGSMPFARRKLFLALLAEETLTTRRVMTILNVSRPTALKLMSTLAALGAVAVRDTREDEDDVEPRGKEISLLPRDEWLLAPEYRWVSEAATNFGRKESQAQRQNALHPEAINETDAVCAFTPERTRDTRLACVKSVGLCRLRQGAQRFTCAMDPQDCAFRELPLP